LGIPDPRGIPTPERALDDTRQIVALVEQETGLTSRWSGEIRFTSAPGTAFLARKLPECPIEFHTDLLGDIEFYYAALEEALHSVSVLTPSPVWDLNPFEGVEEAVVGAMVELLKLPLRRLYTQDEMLLTLSTRTVNHYQTNMAALGQLRRLADREHWLFYRGLLATPLARRHEVIVEWIAEKLGFSVEDVATSPAIITLWGEVQRRHE
jgi:hypothetical protein